MSNKEEIINSEDIIRIMVSTDNHLGFGEKDAIKGEDSFIAFEEMLELAVREDVDFILLGGDLFHDAVPSHNSLHKCMKLLRLYTFGDKPISIELLSEGSRNFQRAINESVNYEDPNLNVAIPIYTIHGNHDDPSTFGGLSSLDLLSTSGLINYFGRWTDLTKIDITPILMKKGVTRLALYGLSHIHDCRLTRLFEHRKVNIQKPSDDDGEWFHLMVIHQNRAPNRGLKNYLPEAALPDFLNLIIWGHEHDCRIEPEFNTDRKFYVCQPGSTVPTSLSEGEALKKHVAILEIYKDKFQLKPIPLKTVRPFVFESVNVLDMYEELHLDEGDISNKVRAMAEQRVECMLEKINNMLTDAHRQPKLPTVRLRIVYSDENQMFNGIRLGQMFTGRVANPADMIHFKKLVNRERSAKYEFDKDTMKREFKNMEEKSAARVEDLVERYFENVDEDKALKVFPSKVLTELCHQLVDRNDSHAADILFKCYKTKILNHLMDNMILEENVGAEIQSFKNNITSDDVMNMLKETVLDRTINDMSHSLQTTDIFENDNMDTSCVNTKTKYQKKNGKQSEPAIKSTDSVLGKVKNRRATRSTSSSSNLIKSNRLKHIMPKLDITINSDSSNMQQQRKTLTNLIDSGNKKSIHKSIYLMSDDSD